VQKELETLDRQRDRLTVRGLRQPVLGVSVAAVLFGGVLWHGVAAQSPASTPAAVHAAAPIAARDIPAGRTSYADLVKAVAPSVVTIRVEGRAQASQTSFDQFDQDDFFRRFFGDRPNLRGQSRPQPKTRGLGSGVVVSDDGYILTNHHVVNGADDIKVDLQDGRTVKATLVGSDQPSDLALLKVSATGLRAMPLGDSDAVEVGDVVLAIGNPLGIGQTVTMGIVSAKSRATGLGEGGYEDFLQTDAPINRGNSGGALVSMKGELIGINSQIMSPSGGNIGIGFAIPSNMASHVMKALRTDGKVRRAQLGVSVQDVTSDLAASLNLPNVSGAIVSSVANDSPAARAGLKRGDVIVAFNGQPVANSNALKNRVADGGVGSRATVRITRDGKQQDLQVTLGEAPNQTAQRDDSAAEGSQASLGVAVAPLTAEMAQQMGLPRTARGLVVQNVQPDSRAASAGLREGDVIQEVNQQPVETVDALRSAVKQGGNKPLLLLVSRDGHDLFLTASAS
jgi:Do/DeqQ family serine protease